MNTNIKPFINLQETISPQLAILEGIISDLFQSWEYSSFHTKNNQTLYQLHKGDPSDSQSYSEIEVSHEDYMLFNSLTNSKMLLKNKTIEIQNSMRSIEKSIKEI